MTCHVSSCCLWRCNVHTSFPGLFPRYMYKHSTWYLGWNDTMCGLLELGDTPGKDVCAYMLQSHKQQLLKGRHNGQQTNNFLRTMIYVCAATYVNSPVHAPCHLLQCFFVSPTCIQNILTYADTCSLLIM